MSASKQVKALLLAIFLVALSATPAAAAPSWSLELDNEQDSLPRSDERMVYQAKAQNSGDTPSSGPVTLTVELPGGEDTSVFNFKAGFPGPAERETNVPHPASVNGWSCAWQRASGPVHASVTCSRSNALAAGASYPPIAIVVHLGEDSEEPIGTANATVSGGGAAAPGTASVQYTFTPGLEFGLVEGFEAGIFDRQGKPFTKAGGHPHQGYTTFGFNAHHVITNEVVPIDNIKDSIIDTSRGFVGNALATPEFCLSIEAVILGFCPDKSSVGGIDVYTSPPEFPTHNIYPDEAPPPTSAFGARPIYSLEPEFGQPAQFAFGFLLGQVPYTFVPELRPAEGYAISFRTAPIVMDPALLGANVTLCDFGATLVNTGGSSGMTFESCKKSTATDAYPNPLITNPTRCAGAPPAAGARMNSWQHPAEVKTAEFTFPAFTECNKVKFEPESELVPTNHEADTPTGLGVEFKMPIEGVLDRNGVAQASLDTVSVTFPEGMSINAASAAGLNACSLAQIKLKSNAPDECPESSRIGSIEIDTPLIRETLKGSVYVASQNDNPFNSLLGLYMVFSSARDGVTVKIAGKVDTDPVTGRLTSTFTENPEWPFSRLALHLNSGPRAPLVNPPRCGIYAIHTEFSPWSAVNPANPTPEEIVSQDSTYEVESGPNGSPCPTLPLDPKLSAGLAGTQAGAQSPFNFSLTREDGTQRFDRLEIATPAGLTAALKGIPYCSDSALASISTAQEAGRPEQASSACPAASQVGTSQAGAGSGPFPFYAPGKVYLAGPYKGAPVSLAVVTPAVAGPFDLGNVVVRNPLYVDPVTAQVRTESDPIPTILHGLILDVRDIRVSLDRPGFTQAPTNCEPKQVDARVSGIEGATVSLANRFQVGGCEKLGFRPKLSFRLFGGTHRGSHPKFRAILRARPGDANTAFASVALPHSQFLDQAHIKTICTRVQFAAKQCPAGAVYGFAEATSPLLGAPLTGPVYLRSSDHELPDLVAALRGPDSQPIEVNLVGRIDSVNGGIRTTFESVPDQPVTSFVLTMQGGKKGLLVNSRDICVSSGKATAKFIAQNGLRTTLRPKLQTACKKAKKKPSKPKRRGR